jgi:hypothetical protein
MLASRGRGQERPKLASRAKLPAAQAEFLAAGLKSLLKEQPRFAVLAKRLLKVGGKAVVARREEDLDRILRRGELLVPRRNGGEWGFRLERMRGGRCYENVGNLWDDNRDRVIIGTGWALSPDGLWRQHSWGVLDGVDIVETTERRLAYYGFALTKREAEKFYIDNSL